MKKERNVKPKNKIGVSVIVFYFTFFLLYRPQKKQNMRANTGHNKKSPDKKSLFCQAHFSSRSSSPRTSSEGDNRIFIL